MDQNIEIIKQIFACGHTAPGLRAMSKHFAADFSYKSVHRGVLNFEEYCQNFALVSSYCEIEIDHIEVTDNCYEAILNINIIHSDTRSVSRMSAKSIFYFEDAIIQYIVSKYSPNAMQLAYILKNIFSFSKAG